MEYIHIENTPRRQTPKVSFFVFTHLVIEYASGARLKAQPDTGDGGASTAKAAARTTCCTVQKNRPSLQVRRLGIVSSM